MTRPSDTASNTPYRGCSRDLALDSLQLLQYSRPNILKKRLTCPFSGGRSSGTLPGILSSMYLATVRMARDTLSLSTSFISGSERPE